MDMVILLFLFLLCFLSVYLILFGEISYRIKVLSLVILSLTLVVFIRMGFNRYFTTTDESYYLSLIARPMWYKTAIVSGYVTPILLRLFYRILGDPVKVVIWNSVFFMVLYVLVIFFSYRRFGFSDRHSLTAILLLFLTRMYLWPTIEARPQQVGLLVGLILVVLTISVNLRPSTVLLFVSIYILLIFSHVLSFILYSTLILGYLTIKIVFGNAGESYLKKLDVTLVSILISWAIFVFMPYSYYLIKNMTWILNNMAGADMTVYQFSLISLGFLVISSAGLYTFVRNLPISVGRFFEVFWNSIVDVLARISSKAILIVAVLGIAGAVVLQIILERSIYSDVYGGSLVSFLFFQMGNIAFGLFYVDGILYKIRQREISDLDILSLLWIFVSVGLLALSFFMPEGKVWTFRNWFLRAIQYFVIFAAPVAAHALLKDEMFKHGFKSIFKPLLVASLVSMLIVISVLNTSRIPGFYDYDVVWPSDLVTLCQHYPSAGYYPRTEGSMYYTEFAVRNLVTACGGELLREPSILQGSVLASSDRFYVYTGNYVPLSLFNFERTPGTRILCGRNSNTLAYAGSLLGISKLVPVRGGEECFSYCLSSADSVILIGGSTSNPCVRVLESSRVVPVRVDSIMVKTPSSIYTTSLGNPWWNTTEGLFVIQAIKYRNVPILILEGTNIDATMAALEYYARSRMHSNSLINNNTHYIVGKWEETDGRVLDVARGSPEDSNGFSPSDRITIIERG
ncbi:hypothetical protein CL1_0852 [Thermococcus cleftensis]|uniref:Uncharacterized protein n=1 Tax=Thermococcus cleftensis (strain DSM 27260 / KACC 17922 / CL1) TaxID=163003 RepID=I3ZTM3_THECF|nr:hypothetical protein [Thermococcus cleftensis]AFL95057.1 hypothetical protein CL1_0852 [Thermococcus cleftensis]